GIYLFPPRLYKERWYGQGTVTPTHPCRGRVNPCQGRMISTSCHQSASHQCPCTFLKPASHIWRFVQFLKRQDFPITALHSFASFPNPFGRVPCRRQVIINLPRPIYVPTGYRQPCRV